MLRRIIIVLILVLGASAASLTRASADSAPPSQVLSNFENHFGASIARDCGFSQPLPGQRGTSLWLFCDTPVYGFAPGGGPWGLTEFITGSSAAEGPATRGLVPTDLSELTSANTPLPAFPNVDGPERFLTVPSGLVTAEGTACGATSASYAASWISGVTRDPALPADLLISFDNYCVEGAFNFHPEGFGLAVYDPATNALTSRLVFSADTTAGLTAPLVLGSPVSDDGYLYLYNYVCASESYTCGASPGNAVYLARVPADPSAWDDSAAYQWFVRPGTWSSAPASAGSVIPGDTAIAGIDVGDFRSVGHGFALIAQESLEGAFTVYQARSPAGPWKVTTTGTVPCPADTIDCHAIIGHPELSTRGSLLISFFNPGAVPFYNPSAPASTDGHLEIAAFPW